FVPSQEKVLLKTLGIPTRTSEAAIGRKLLTRSFEKLPEEIQAYIVEQASNGHSYDEILRLTRSIGKAQGLYTPFMDISDLGEQGAIGVGSQILQDIVKEAGGAGSLSRNA